MHVHGSSMQWNPANLQPAAAAEKAAASQRSTDVRKKLINGGLALEEELSPEAGLMVQSWTEKDSQQQPSSGEGQRHPAPPAGFPADNAEQGVSPVSFWA